MSGDRDRWRLILGDGDDHTPTPHPGAYNMAVDRALLASVGGGAAPVLRLYRWSPPTLSFGRNQPARGLYDEEEAARRGIAFVRRPTGGQAVLHDDELTYAVVAPVAVVGKPREAYRRINEVLVAGLRGLGVEAGVVSDGSGEGEGHGHGPGPVQGQGQGEGPPVAVRDASAWAEACFRHPERGEVVAGGRKLVGSAQRTEARTILQHGSILLGGTQAAAEDLLLTPPSGRGRRVDPRSSILDARDRNRNRRGGQVGGGGEAWTTIESELGRRVAVEAVAAAVVSAFEDSVGITLARSTLTPEESAGAAELRGRFESRAWTWRR